MYTKAAQKKLERDVERAKRENFGFAAKLVRGAYMVMERKVTKEKKSLLHISNRYKMLNYSFFVFVSNLLLASCSTWLSISHPRHVGRYP